MSFLTIEKIENHHLLVFWSIFGEMLGSEASPHFSNQMTWQSIHTMIISHTNNELLLFSIVHLPTSVSFAVANSLPFQSSIIHKKSTSPRKRRSNACQLLNSATAALLNVFTAYSATWQAAHASSRPA
jgi:hypothetical protein